MGIEDVDQVQQPSQLDPGPTHEVCKSVYQPALNSKVQLNSKSWDEDMITIRYHYSDCTRVELPMEWNMLIDPNCDCSEDKVKVSWSRDVGKPRKT